jgi:hypothetical protein
MRSIRSILITLVLCTLLLPLSGCGKKTESDIQAETINSLYTDDNKLVFAVGDIYKLVYYHDEDGNITGVEHYYEYSDETTANEKCEEDKESLKNDASIKNITCKGNYVIYTISDTEWGDLTLEKVKSTYSYLSEVEK